MKRRRQSYRNRIAEIPDMNVATDAEILIKDINDISRSDEPPGPFEPYGSIVEPNALDWESTARDMTRPGSYRNTGIVSWQYSEIGSICAGINAPERTEALYLDLNCSEASDGHEIGYYVTASTGSLHYSRGFIGEYDAEENSPFSDFMIADRLFTRVRAVQYTDERNKGIRWMDEYRGAESCGGATVSVRAVNLSTGGLVCICDIEIAFDEQDKVYYLSGFHSADVHITGEMDSERRSELVTNALRFAEEQLPIELSEIEWEELGIQEEEYDWEAAAIGGAVVDKISRAYFNKLLGEISLAIIQSINTSLGKDNSILIISVGSDLKTAGKVPFDQRDISKIRAILTAQRTRLVKEIQAKASRNKIELDDNDLF